MGQNLSSILELYIFAIHSTCKEARTKLLQDKGWNRLKSKMNMQKMEISWYYKSNITRSCQLKWIKWK